MWRGAMAQPSRVKNNITTIACYGYRINFATAICMGKKYTY